MSRPLDGTDWRILSELQDDGRLSFNQLGRKVNLSPPAVWTKVSNTPVLTNGEWVIQLGQYDGTERFFRLRAP